MNKRLKKKLFKNLFTPSNLMKFRKENKSISVICQEPIYIFGKCIGITTHAPIIRIERYIKIKENCSKTEFDF